MSNQILTAKQTEIVNKLNETFGINPERILFLNPRDQNDPWIPSDELESIARQTEGCQQISVGYDKYIPETKQVIFTATVVTLSGMTFTHPGVAATGESPNGISIEPETLAAGRALGAALRAAGFHPYKSGSVVDFGVMREQIENRAAATEQDSRAKDLRQIHALAVEKGLTTGGNDTAYRMWLNENFLVKTAIGLNAEDRARVINQLKNYVNEFAMMQQEFGEGDALAA